MTTQRTVEKAAAEAGAMGMEELLALPATVNVVTAGRALGISPNTAYELIKNGEFPVRTLRLGNMLKVPTALLWEALGIKGPWDGQEQ